MIQQMKSQQPSNMIVPQWVAEAIPWDIDASSGAVIEQLTSEPVTSTNIYPEQRFASADGTRIAIERRPFGRPCEIWVCDMRSLKLCKACEGQAIGGNAKRNKVYVVETTGTGAKLLALDLVQLSLTPLANLGQDPPHNGAVSPDERWFVGGPYPVENHVYELRRVDFETGEISSLCRITDMLNPHVQFNPADERQLMIQINRGGRRNPDGIGNKRVGSAGVTLSLVDVMTGEVRSLPVGRPHTLGPSGHECWVGDTGSLLFTGGRYQVSVSSHVTLREPTEQERAMPPAAIYRLTPGDEAARVVACDYLYNHIAASDDGRFFVADDHATGRIFIGSITTGKSLGLCDSRTRQGACQHSHIHAYLTPDNRYVIYNSVVTGVAQVYAACIPDGFLQQVLEK